MSIIVIRQDTVREKHSLVGDRTVQGHANRDSGVVEGKKPDVDVPSIMSMEVDGYGREEKPILTFEAHSGMTERSEDSLLVIPCV